MSSSSPASSSSSSCCCCSEYEKEQEQQQEELNCKEESLRRFLKDKPQNARKMSELALLLAEKAAVSTSASTPSKRSNDTNNQSHEALEWAQRAIQVAGTKPYGYVALSVVLLQQHENNNNQEFYARRIEALRSAIQYMDSPTTTTTTATAAQTVRALWVTRIVLLVRLLLEPRQQELLDGNRVLAKLSSALHPSRRQLDAHENALYHQIKEEMSLFSSGPSLENDNYKDTNGTPDCGVLLTAQQHETLAMRCDYRLGLFLRKKLPAQVYLPLARFHWQRAVSRLEIIQALSSSSSSSPLPRHPKLDLVQFWLATMKTTHDTNSYSNADVPTTRIMDRCPKDYVIGLYATFAERFDDLLVNKLDYQTPALLRQLVQQAIRMNSKHIDAAQYYYFHKAVDLGCGTGLSGMAFRDLIAPFSKGGSLTGIDLSPQMIAKAKQRRFSSPTHVDGDHDAVQSGASCYDVLLVGDLERALDMGNQGDNGSDDDDNLYSLVFACDVFCYIGDLKQVFRRVYNALTRRGGIFAFSVEMLSSQPSATCTLENVVPFQLHECARFAHSQDYLNNLARGCGFSILQTQTCPIRKNQGDNVMGLLYVLEKGKRPGS